MRWNTNPLLLPLLLLALALPVPAGAAPDVGTSGPPAEVAGAVPDPAGATETALPPSGAAPGEAIPAPTSPPSPVASSPTVVSTGSPPIDPGPPSESTPAQPIPGVGGSVQPGPGTATRLPEVTAAVLASPQFADFLKRMLEDPQDPGDPWGARIGIGVSGVVLGLLVGALLWKPKPLLTRAPGAPEPPERTASA